MNEAVTTAKRERSEQGGVRTLSTGVRARLKPVSQMIIQEALLQLEEPKVPMWHNPDKDRDEPNPMDPGYRRALVRYAKEQTRVAFDCCAMFGIELVDGMPEDDKWLNELRFMEKLGRLDLSQFDLEDPVDREFVYKRYVAMGNTDFGMIGRMSGVNEEEIRAAESTFQRDEERGEDQ